MDVHSCCYQEQRASSYHEIFVRHAADAQLRWSGPGLSERALDVPFTSHVGGTDMDIAPWQEVQIGNPSNPAGSLIPYDTYIQLVKICEDKGI